VSSGATRRRGRKTIDHPAAGQASPVVAAVQRARREGLQRMGRVAADPYRSASSSARLLPPLSRPAQETRHARTSQTMSPTTISSGPAPALASASSTSSGDGLLRLTSPADVASSASRAARRTASPSVGAETRGPPALPGRRPPTRTLCAGSRYRQACRPRRTGPRGQGRSCQPCYPEPAQMMSAAQARVRGGAGGEAKFAAGRWCPTPSTGTRATGDAGAPLLRAHQPPGPGWPGPSPARKRGGRCGQVRSVRWTERLTERPRREGRPPR
jgi:hypothetical protein